MVLSYNLDKIKRHIGVSINHTEDDERIRDLFYFVTADVQKYIGFDLSSTDYAEEKHILNWWENTIDTLAFPINSITEVTVNGTEITSDYYWFNARIGQIVIKNTYALNLGHGKNQFLVTYNAGFSTFPKDVEESIYILIGKKYNKTSDLKSSSDLSSSEVYVDSIGYLPPEVFRAWNNYKRNVF